MATYKGLTLEEIIECFTDPSNNMDSQLLNIFLYTYRNYCSSMDIIKLVNSRMHSLNERVKINESNADENMGFTRAVISLLNGWLTFPFAYDFCELPDFKSVNYLLKKIRSWPKIISFIRSSASFQESFRRLEDKISNVLNVFSTMGESTERDYRELPVDCEFKESFLVNCQFRDNQYNCSLLYQPPELIAKSLTYLDQKVLENLKLQELLSYIRKQPAPSVISVIDKYNELYNAVLLTVREPGLARKRFDQYQYSGRNSPISFDHGPINDQVVSHKKTDQIFQVIEKWIQIVQVLSNLRNYSSLMAILTALDSPENMAIMKKSSKLYNQYQLLVKINEPHINQHEDKMVRPESGSQNSTNSVKSKGKHKNLKIQHTEIPYLGIYLKNLAIIDDGFPDFLNSSTNVYNGNEERLINLDKCRRQFDVLVQVKLCIAAIKNNEITPDEPFLKWYSEIQRECSKEKLTLSNSSTSLESVKSTNSNDSNISSQSLNYKPHELKTKNKFFQYKSHQSLNDEVCRKRSQSIPLKNSAAPVDVKLCKVATVKFLQPKCHDRTLTHLYRSSNHVDHSHTLQRKPETISSAQCNQRARPPIMHVVRSASALHKLDTESKNLQNILYKKLQVNEKDHTHQFIERVFEKFGLADLDPSHFEVVQRLDNGREITITDNANLFYALAEQKHYQLEVQAKRNQIFS